MPGERLVISAATVVVLIVGAAGCGRGSSDPDRTNPANPPTASGTRTGEGTPAPATTAPQRFQSTIRRVTAADLPHSWRRGCPVSPSGLRMIEMTYWGMDDRAHAGGRLVVNAEAAEDLVTVFRRLFAMRYPIRRMEPVDRFRGSDFDSIEADNTSAFNCRRATGSTSFSQHAYGLAVDLNPCENPYVSSDGTVAHRHCVKFKNRNLDAPGVIHANDRVVRAFASIGWGWGGNWSGVKDYQHFSASGR
ncbi:M15 family metallopeptidase [Actinomadura sp. SCN-SB]|uniref:M15 family metallopeptidase n=1 Tax=Actinomadura sp. SCN-SB TaxID=3373092 RepID=UPI00375282E9